MLVEGLHHAADHLVRGGVRVRFGVGVRVRVRVRVRFRVGVKVWVRVQRATSALASAARCAGPSKMTSSWIW